MGCHIRICGSLMLFCSPSVGEQQGRNRLFMKKLKNLLLLAVALLAVSVWTWFSNSPLSENIKEVFQIADDDERGLGQGGLQEISLEQIAEYSGDPYIVINDNIPFFSKDDYTTESFEHYSSLDRLGRCGTAYANIGLDIMPTEERGKIGSVKPSGWHTVKYDNVDGKYLYNRCHLIGYQLAGENANEKNLITGTRYLNIDGMLSFENKVAEYVHESGNHVLYRVTPMFYGTNLLANGVLMEAWSVEDEGQGICFNVFAYNVQPGIEIDYATGESRSMDKADDQVSMSYVLNTHSRKFHKPSCTSVEDIKEKNKEVYYGSRAAVISEGYEPCGICNP